MAKETKLDVLPVELLYTIHHISASHSLPCVNKRLFAIFRDTSSVYRAEYLIARYTYDVRNTKSEQKKLKQKCIISFALQYPICDEATLEALVNSRSCPEIPKAAPSLPRRLFKNLALSNTGGSSTLGEDDYPLPFLRYLFNRPPWVNPSQSSNKASCSSPSTPVPAHFFAPSANSHDGYPLARAVHAGHTPLIHFLLSHNASPSLKDSLPLRIAIRKGDVALVKLLVERHGSCSSSEWADTEASGRKIKQQTNGKRRRLEDRVEISLEMLKTAVDVGAKEVARYMVHEKGVRPDVRTLQLMDKRGFFGDE